jgi:hypothetical protein
VKWQRLCLKLVNMLPVPIPAYRNVDGVLKITIVMVYAIPVLVPEPNLESEEKKFNTVIWTSCHRYWVPVFGKIAGGISET